MENFTKLPHQLLKRTDITPTHKLIIVFLQSYQNNNKYYYAGVPQLAKELGLSLTTTKDNIKQLEKRGIIFKSQDKKYINAAFNNRKAIVVVDTNNPFPTNEVTKETTKEVSKKTSKELNKENNINTPEVSKKPLKTEETIKENKTTNKLPEIDFKALSDEIDMDSRQNGINELDLILETKKPIIMKKRIDETEEEFMIRFNIEEKKKRETTEILSSIEPTNELKALLSRQSKKDYSYLTPGGNIKK